MVHGVEIKKKIEQYEAKQDEQTTPAFKAILMPLASKLV